MLGPDLAGIKAREIKVQVEENNNVLVLSRERRREKEIEESGVKYVRMKRRIGKSIRKFVLPKNANLDAISAEAENGVLASDPDLFSPPHLDLFSFL
ncbi:hypothetical protein ACE6H2_021865 [Prunus campanulata]